MNKDRLVIGGDPNRLRMAVFDVISKSQDDPAMQVKAIAVALLSVCDACDIDLKQLLVSMERMRNDLDGPFQATFRAITEYARNELGRGL